MKSIELLLQQLETATDLLSKFQLGYLYDKGELLTQDDIRALAGYQQAAAMEAQNHLEEKYKVFAIYNLGVMHFYGQGTAVNLQEALTWINRAAESGNANALWMLGQMHEQGKGVIKNYNEALRYYALAAKQNLPGANFDLGRMRVPRHDGRKICLKNQVN